MQSKEFKEKVLEVVLQMLETSDWQGISIRSIAQQINYTPAAIYKHFRNKDEILWELMRLGHARMYTFVFSQLNVNQEFTPLMLQMAALHWDFAAQHPQWYKLIYLTAHPNPTATLTPDENALKIIQFVTDKINEALPQYADRNWELFSGAINMIIGYCSQYLYGKTFGTAAEVKKRMLNNLERFIKGAMVS